MPIRRVDVPALGWRLSNLMAAPSSAKEGTHGEGLEAYRGLGGNCIHLHGEGGETHSRRAVGKWLKDRGARGEFFLCSQVCHDGWDEARQSAVERFTPEALREDIGADLDLLGTGYLDMVYWDDHAERAFEPMVEAIGGEIRRGRVRAFGVRNCLAGRIRGMNGYAARGGMAKCSAVVTTEFSLLKAVRPMWPEYVPFDGEMRRVVVEEGMAVMAHVDFGNLRPLRLEEAGTRGDRWDTPENEAIALRARAVAMARGLTVCDVTIAYLLSQSWPVVGIVGLPLLMANGEVYERGSENVLTREECAGLAFSPTN